MTVTNEGREIARMLRDVIGGAPRVVRYWDDSDSHCIDMFSSENQPVEGVTSYATIGLSSYDIAYTVEGKDLRVEFIGACASRYGCFANIMSSCAFNIIKNNYTCAPGVIFPDIIAQYFPASDMKHILFTSPFLWENLKKLTQSDKLVTWLMAVPISEREFSYAKEHGAAALEDEFEKYNIDIYHLERASVL